MSAGLATAAILLLPIALPYLRGAYSAVKAARSRPTRSATTVEKWQLLAIACLVVFHLASAARYVLSRHETNIFKATNSRFVVPTDVLHARVMQNPDLEPLSEWVWSMLESAEGRLLYLNYGSGPLEDCIWCSLDSMQSYFWFIFGKLGLLYLAQLSVVALVCAGDRLPWIIVSVIMFAAEFAVRCGALDDYNLSAARASEIVPINDMIPPIRHAVFAAELVLVAIQTFFIIRFSGPAAGLVQAKIDLVLGIECLRVGNSASRAIHDTPELEQHANSYWQRQREMQDKFNADPDVVAAREKVRNRLGSNLAVEKQRLRQFVERLWSIR